MIEDTSILAIIITMIEDHTGLPISVFLVGIALFVTEVILRVIPSHKEGGILVRLLTFGSNLFDLFVQDRVKGEPRKTLKERFNSFKRS